jgi:type VI secretion system secreted protein VgrG
MKLHTFRCLPTLWVMVSALSLPPAALFAQGTAFTYQGQLTDGATPASGNYDLRFTAYDVAGGGSAVAGPLTNSAVGVTNGLFTVALDFGSGAYNGDSRWLEIGVRTNGGGAFAPLAPRQPLTPVPYAMYAPSAGVATLATNLPAGTVTSGMIADGAVTDRKIAPLSVKLSSLDDGGSLAYDGFVNKAKSFQSAEALPFEALLPAATNGGAPSLALRLDGEAFGTVQGFVGQEGISEPYAFVVEATASRNSVNPDAQLGRQGRIIFNRGGRSTAFSGIVTGCSASSYDDTRALYTFRIESPLALLALSSDYRVYQEARVQNIAASNYLATTGTALSMSLSGTYPQRDCVIQHGQSNADFFNRLLEEEGISYFFNPSATPPVLTLADAAGSWPAAPYDSIPYYGNLATNIPPGAEFIRSFQQAKHQSTRRVTLKSYNFKTPGVNLTSSTQLADGVGEQYQFGSALTTQTDLNANALARAERQTTERNASLADGNAADLRPGHTFTLQDRSENGLDGSYLVTRVRHAAFRRVTNGVSSLFYGNQCEVVPAATPFRPAIKTPKPAAHCCSAVVVGPAGEEVYTDSYGRVKVQFRWDRQGANDQNSSAWIRVASPWAGNGWGMIFPPRIGQEVIVDFLHGDPDQPVIIGSLHNANQMPPYSLPANKTRSGIRTRSTKGGDPGNYNELRFEDLKGSEEILLHGEKDVTIEAKNNMTISAAGALSIATPSLSASGAVVASGFTGSGSGLTSLNAAHLSSGTVPSARLSGTYSSALTLNNAANSFTGNGAGLTSLNASALSSGLVPLAQLPAAVVTNNESGVTLNALSLAGITSLSGNLVMNDKDFQFRGSGDSLHGLGWYGSSKLFGSVNVNGPVLYGNGGGALGAMSGVTNIALQWDASRNVAIGGNLTVSGHGRLNEQTLYLRSGSDLNHGLGWYGVGKTYGALSVDGPALFGYSGGVLGTVNSGSSTNVALCWNNSGNVGIGNTSPTNKLMVGNARCDGSSWINASDRNLKEDFAPVDAQSVLAQVAALPVQTWSYKAQPGQKHLGPVAQDFRAAFGLGADDTSIATVDAAGVALAAIQGLNQKLEQTRAENARLKQELAELKRLVGQLVK